MSFHLLVRCSLKSHTSEIPQGESKTQITLPVTGRFPFPAYSPPRETETGNIPLRLFFIPRAAGLALAGAGTKAINPSDFHHTDFSSH